MKIKITMKFFICVLIICIFSYGCSIDKKDENELTKISNYVINKSSKRIHIETCNSAKIMSEKNKLHANDSINNLVNNGYVICKNCNAGVKKYNSIISYFFKKLNINNDIKYEDYFILTSKEDYIKSIDEIGDWYVNHIPTYQKTIQTDAIDNYDGEQQYVREIQLKKKYMIIFNMIQTFNVATDNEEINISSLRKNDLIMKANECAADNYKNNYSNIHFYKSLAYYPCEYIVDSEDDYDSAGDDCVRFFFTVMNCVDASFTSRLKYFSGRDWSKIDSYSLTNNNDLLVYAMNKLGFDIYDSFHSNSQPLLNGKLKIKPISDDFVLEKGDVISREGHIHIYLGNDNGKDCFGWGRVYRKYPVERNFSLKRDSNGYNYIVINEETVKNKELKYTRVYRFVGGMNNEKVGGD